MCGIAGLAGPDAGGARGVECVERQLACLEHRGPDARGVYGRGPATVGQNRLAVIDLVTGDPPITNEDGSIGVVLNGEVHNHRQLRTDLSREGHRLATMGDTEVIAHLAEVLDPVSLARRLEGMFAFAVWDARRERLVLGRDRLGKKPLYYWEEGGRLAFASEIKALLVAPHVPRRLDPGAIPAYLAFGYVPTPRTFFDQVRSVPPGHVLIRERDGGIAVEPYWAPEIPAPEGADSLDLSLEEAAGEVRRLLGAAVRRRMVSDVPLGAFLSGGVDSTAVVGLMAEASPRPVATFTIGFDDHQGFDERPYARIAAERFGTDHVDVVVAPDAVELVERLVWHHDQPFGDSSAVPTFLLCELARRDVTVALCGDGGDELFAGYPRFNAALAAHRWGRWAGPLGRALTRPAWPLFGGTPQSRPAHLRRFLASAGQGLPDAYLEWGSVLGPAIRGRLTGEAESWATEEHRRLWVATEGSDTLDRLLDLNLRTYLLDDLLPKTDRSAMAHGLEVRSPYLDRELVELALRLPRAHRVRGLTGKRVLRAAVRDLLPDAIATRSKQGFGVPIDRWLRGELRLHLERTVGADDARLRAHLAPAPLKEMVAQHVAGAANHGQALWTLLMLETFLRREKW